MQQLQLCSRMRSTPVSSGHGTAWGGRMHPHHHPATAVSSPGSLQHPALHRRPICIQGQLPKPQSCTVTITQFCCGSLSAGSSRAQPQHTAAPAPSAPAPEGFPGTAALAQHQTAHSPSAEIPALLPSELSQPTGRIPTLISTGTKAE